MLDSIYGRKQDFIINKELKKVPIGPALFDYNFDWSGIEKFQIEQNYPGKLNIQLVYLDKNKNNIHLGKKIISKFKKLLNFQFDIKLIEMKNIEFTKRGKFKYLIQNINYEKTI